MKRIVLLIFSVFIIILLNSCSNNAIDEISHSQSNIIDKNKMIISSIGFDTSSVIDHGNYYTVEGDIRIYKKEISNYNITNTRQARIEYLVSTTKQKNILVKIDNSLSAYGVDDWRDAIQEAINEWNQVGSNLHISLTTNSNYDILIRSDNGTLSDMTLAEASWVSSNGDPGPTIDVNLDFYNNSELTDSQKKYNIVHELGHCFGFRHTNWNKNDEPSGITIPGTPDNTYDPDPESVMNGRTAFNSWNGFSNYDIVAIRVLYNGCYIVGPDYLCDATEQIFTLINVPPGASVTWSNYGYDNKIDYLSPAVFTGNPYIARNTSEKNKQILLEAEVTLSDGYSYSAARFNLYVYNAQTSGAYIETFDNIDFSLRDYDPWAKDFQWEVSEGVVYLQGRDNTLIDFSGNSNSYTVICRYTSRCGQRITVTKNITL